MRICKIEGCQGKHDSYGMCGKHAQRFRRYGDPYYLTSEEERRERLRNAQPNLGKLQPQTYKKFHGRHEHRVVAEKMIGRPLKKGEVVHHIDGNKHNNDPSNLQITTQREHIKHHLTEMKELNTRPKIVFDGESLTVSEWSRKTGLSIKTICSRIKLGWPISKVLTLPPDSSRRVMP